jgi:hypothetical protein
MYASHTTTAAVLYAHQRLPLSLVASLPLESSGAWRGGLGVQVAWLRLSSRNLATNRVADDMASRLSAGVTGEVEYRWALGRVRAALERLSLSVIGRVAWHPRTAAGDVLVAGQEVTYPSLSAAVAAGLDVRLW